MSIPGSVSPLFLGAAGQATGGYEIERSLRFNSSDSAYLSRTPASAGNRKTWTWAGWVKRSKLENARLSLFTAGSDGAEFFFEQSAGADTLKFYYYNNSASAYQGDCRTTAVFRDASAWYHIVLTVDITQATASNRCKIYVNGVQQDTTFANDFIQNADLDVNNTVAHNIGKYGSSSSYYFDGYLADVHFIDGQALDPSSFGEFDANGVWQPIDASGLTYGTNGFHLPFSDNSTAAAIGTDTSGNSNTWTVNNFSVTQGNGNYVSGQFSGDVRSLTDAYGPRNMFNGILGSESVSGAVCFATYSGDSTCTWTPTTTITGISSLRIYADLSGSTGKLTVNGTDYSSLVTALSGGDGWVTIPQSSLSSIAFGYTGGLGSATGIAAVEVNGVILLDNLINSNIDSLVDSPTNYGTDDGLGGSVRGNYATLNPLDKSSSFTLSNGNLDAATSSGYYHAYATIFPASGKYYLEMLLSRRGGNGGIALANILSTSSDISATKVTLNGWSGGYQVYVNSTSNNVSGFTSANANDILKLAYDAGTGEVWFGVNEYWITNSYARQTSFPSTSTGTVSTPVKVQAVFNNIDGSFNFGQRPFAYTAPSGFKALCTTNLPEPTIADGSTAMDVALYTGNGSTQTISGLGFSPDFVWIKSRSGSDNHAIQDAVRGATYVLQSNTTNAEVNAANTVGSFTSDGFTLAGGAGSTNGSSVTYAAWTWDAGSSTVTNTQGSISSQVRANASAGFSVVTYTGNGTYPSTVGHGLGVAPHMIILKIRNQVRNWFVYHKAAGTGAFEGLNTAAAYSSYSPIDGSDITSTTFKVVDGNSNASSDTLVAYCFAPVAGYSSFGSYTGNGSADGPFVYTGFRPRWILIKVSAGDTGNWWMYDSARSSYNLADSILHANLSLAEFTSNGLDMLSNGFKIRTANGNTNGSGFTFVWAAFAENPFQYARAR